MPNREKKQLTQSLIVDIIAQNHHAHGILLFVPAIVYKTFLF